MPGIKLEGIEEIMLCHSDMDASKFFKMNVGELRGIIDNNIIDKSFRVFVLATEKLKIGDKKRLSVKSSILRKIIWMQLKKIR